MDDLRQRLLEQKLGDLLDWQKPQVIQTIGPYDPSVFDNFEALLAEAVNLLRERLEGYTDAEIGILVDKESEDLDGLRKDWMSILGDATEKRLRNPPPWYADGLGHPDYRADFEYWSKMPNFSIFEIVCLSVGIAPEKYGEKKLSDLSKRRDRLKLWPSLKFLLQRYDLVFRTFGAHVNSVRFLIWAEQVDLEMPTEFGQRLRNYHHPPYPTKQDNSAPSEPDKRQIDKVAQLFTAMAIDAYGYAPNELRSPIPKEITDMAASMGLQVSTDTVRKYLKIGASFIPEDWQPE